MFELRLEKRVALSQASACMHMRRACRTAGIKVGKMRKETKQKGRSVKSPEAELSVYFQRP